MCTIDRPRDRIGWPAATWAVVLPAFLISISACDRFSADELTTVKSGQSARDRASGQPKECDNAYSSTAVIEREHLEDEPAQLQLPVTPASFVPTVELGDVVSRVDEVLVAARTYRVPGRSGCWMRWHALLACEPGDQSTGPSTAASQLVNGILNASEPAVASLELRNGLPFPKQSGEKTTREHHRDQLLYKLSCVNVPLTYPFVLEGHSFTVSDLFKSSKRESRLTGDVSWSVSAYAWYLTPGEKWTNKFGEELTLAKLVAASIEQESAFCFGTHRLLGLARVLTRPELIADPELKAIRPLIVKSLQAGLDFFCEAQRSDGSFVHAILERGVSEDGSTRAWSADIVMRETQFVGLFRETRT